MDTIFVLLNVFQKREKFLSCLYGLFLTSYAAIGKTLFRQLNFRLHLGTDKTFLPPRPVPRPYTTITAELFISYVNEQGCM